MFPIVATVVLTTGPTTPPVVAPKWQLSIENVFFYRVLAYTLHIIFFSTYVPPGFASIIVS